MCVLAGKKNDLLSLGNRLEQEMGSCAVMEKLDGFLEIHQKVKNFYVASKPKE